MPYDIRIIRSQEFVCLDAEGHFDLQGSRKFLADAITACSFGQIGRVLLDVRDATADFTTAQVIALANVCREITAPPDEHKIAILTRKDMAFNRATYIAEIAQSEGWNIAAFQEFEHAFTWLSETRSV